MSENFGKYLNHVRRKWGGYKKIVDKMYKENCTAWQSVLQRTDTPCIVIRKKFNTYHARVLYCERESVSSHYHIQAGSGVYALLYIYIYLHNTSGDRIIGVKTAGTRLWSRNFVYCHIQITGHKAIADHKQTKKQTNKRNTNTTIQTK
jgi:hypothetical protein